VKENDETSVKNKQTTRKHGILLNNAIVSQTAEIKVITPERTQNNVIIYDNLGNAVFEASDKTNSFVWNLKNKAGRNVANGSSLIIVEAKGISGKLYWYSAKVGVKR
jgi:hypothetical protein